MPILLATAYLPPVAYIAACLKNDEIWIEAFESYIKQTCRNRCIIYGPNGVQILTIPVKKSEGHRTMVSGILVDNTSPWQKLQWRSIETAYNKSPFFLYYRDLFEPFFIQKPELLIEFNTRLLEQIFLILRIETTIGFTWEYEKEVENDQRDLLVSKRRDFTFPFYFQPFSPKHGFLSNLSVIDLLFNKGPQAMEYLEEIVKSNPNFPRATAK